MDGENEKLGIQNDYNIAGSSNSWVEGGTIA